MVTASPPCARFGGPPSSQADEKNRRSDREKRSSPQRPAYGGNPCAELVHCVQVRLTGVLVPPAAVRLVLTVVPPLCSASSLCSLPRSRRHVDRVEA